MRERDAAMAMGTESELGEYVKFASPSFSDEWIFFGGISLFGWCGGGVAITRILEHRAHLSDRIGVWVALVYTLGLLTVCLLPTWWRRPGGKEPRLYLFTDGFVLALRGNLNVYRWTEITIARRKWATGSGDNYDSGTSRTLSTHDGRVLVTFRGNEPSRSGYYEVDKLHEAAVARAT